MLRRSKTTYAFTSFFQFFVFLIKEGNKKSIKSEHFYKIVVWFKTNIDKSFNYFFKNYKG